MFVYNCVNNLDVVIIVSVGILDIIDGGYYEFLYLFVFKNFII